MYLLLLILLLAGGLLVCVLIRLILRDIQDQRRHEAYREYIMAYGSEEEKESLMIEEMDDLMLGMGGLMMLDLIDGELDGEMNFI